MTQEHKEDMAEQAAGLLEGALVSGDRLDGLPVACQPHDLAQAYDLQSRFAARLGRRGGWKVGAGDPEAMPRFAPVPARLLQEGVTELPFTRFSSAAIEAEIAFKLGRDLPPREHAYSRAEVLEAVSSVHAVIEIVDSRFVGWPASVDALTQLADLQNNGFLVVGEGRSDWQSLPLESLEVTLSIDGTVVVKGRGGNPAGDPVALLVWLANALPDYGHALHAGEVVTCGSCTGKYPADQPLNALASFEGLGRAELRLV